MNSKSEKLFKLLEKLGFWHQGLPLKDLYPKNKEITEDHKMNVLDQYINSKEYRIILLEWLLSKFNKDILADYDKEIDKRFYDTDEFKIERIKNILLDLGIFWNNKHTKNLDLTKVVEGIAGEEPSFQLVYNLTKFVNESKTPAKIENEVDDLTMLSEMCMNKDRLLNNKLNYFPIEFPKKYTLEIDDVHKEVISLQEKYKEKTFQLEEKFVNLKDEGKEVKVDIEFAGEQLKQDYSDALQEFSDLMKQQVSNATKKRSYNLTLYSFVEEFKIKKIKMKNAIHRFESNKVDIPEDLPDLFENFKNQANKLRSFNRELEQTDLDSLIQNLKENLEQLNDDKENIPNHL